MFLSSSLSSHYEKFLATGEVKCIDDEIPFEIPEGWEWERWGNISMSIQYGYNAPALEKGTIRMVRISDIQNNKVVWESVPFCSIPENDVKLYLLQPNDILFARTGGTVGKSFLVEDVPLPVIYAGYLIRTRYSSLLCPLYMKAFMESQLYWEQLKSGTIATAQPNCNGKTLSRMLLPIPPAKEQSRIIVKVKELSLFVDRYRKSQEALDQLNTNISVLLKKSILQEAIQGKLVPQDPSGEPASELLKRIREEKQKLVKEGKLKKKDITDSVIFRGDDNRHYEKIESETIEIDIELTFPRSWQIARLGDVCRMIDGEKKSERYPCLDAKFLRSKAMATMLNAGKFVGTGSNIILVDGENSGEVFSVPLDGYMGSTFKQLWISSEMYVPYVLNFIRFYKDQLRNSKKGAAIPHLNKDIFYNLVIGIPPFDEQKRISQRVACLVSMLS